MPPTPTPRTETQRTASRLNSATSKGPTTPDGRRISSRNSTKHGLSGSGLHLPPDMAAESPSEISLFASAYHPRTPYEHDLIRRAALANLRAKHISDTLNSLCDDRARTATRIWDETRASEISSLADLLPQYPATAISQLRRTAEGCDYLGDAFESLAQSLQTHGFLDDSQSLRLLNLLGHPEPPSLKDDSHPLHHLYLSLLFLQFNHNPRSLMRTTFRHVRPPKPTLRPTKSPLQHTKIPLHHTTEPPPHHTKSPLHHPDSPPSSPESALLDHVRTLLPDPSIARADLAQFLQSQIADLETQGNQNWNLYDKPSRQSAPVRAAFAPTPETLRLERYLASAERLRRQSLTELHRLRQSPVPNEPEPGTQAPLECGDSSPLSSQPRQNEPEPGAQAPLACGDSSPLSSQPRQNEPEPGAQAPLECGDSSPLSSQPRQNEPEPPSAPPSSLLSREASSAPLRETPSPVPNEPEPPSVLPSSLLSPFPSLLSREAPPRAKRTRAALPIATTYCSE